ncbi:MAG: DUF2339 domain-containing protein, partial [Polyangiaceae bacterium]
PAPGPAPGPAPEAAPEQAPSPAPSPLRIDWESFVGVRLFSWVAGIAFALAALFFLRYSIDQGLLGPPIRLAIGVVAGMTLVVLSEARGHRWRVTANALEAAGIATLFATFFAASTLWHLIHQALSFALMVLVTAVAVALATRRRSMFIALLGLVGGFATPILLSTGEDRPIGLFAYLLILNAGLAWVGRRQRWRLLIALSVGFTAVYQWGWVIKFVSHEPEELPIAAGVFLVFPALVALSRLVPEHEPGEDARSSTFERIATVSALLPILFALCFAWVPAFGEHYVLLFSYLLLLDVGLAVLAARTRNALLQDAAALGTLLVFFGWLPLSYGAFAWPAVLGIVSLFVVFFLGVPSVRARIAAPLLLGVFPVLLSYEPASAAPLLPFAVLFALMALVATVAIRERAGALYFIASFFAVVAEAVWSARYLAPGRLHAALLLYAAFGLFYLGVPLVARRLERPLRPGWGAPALLVASLALLLFLAAGPVAHIALWGMALLLAILNLGLFFDVRPGRISTLAAVGMVLSWLVIAVWWATAMVASLLLPALAIVGGFAVLLLGGNLWAQRQTGGEGATRHAVYLGLVAHLFLLFVATQPSLATPPWPTFGVLFVLDLAILVAAVYARRAELHVAAVGASQLVVALWVLTTHDMPSRGLAWPKVGLVAGLAIALLALVALPLARRRGANHVLFPSAAAVALLGAQVVVVAASASDQAPPVVWLAVAQVVAITWLAAVAGSRGWDKLMVAALVPHLVGTGLWTLIDFEAPHWRDLLALAAAPYALWLAYPLWRGRAAPASRAAHLAAVLASGVFFLFARTAILAGPWAGYIGVLPVGQALLLVGLLVRILRVEPPGARDRGRLALVAGTALAFVTVAIPLQLDNEWITIGWALETAALSWLYGRIPHRGILVATLGLGAAVVTRLSLNPAVFEYHPRAAAPIWNFYLYTYLVAAIALLAAAALLTRTDDRFARIARVPRVSSLAWAGGTLLLFLLLNIEIADYWSTGAEITFNFSSGIAQDLTYTLGWAVFAVALLTAGILTKARAARLTALVLLVVTVGKCFLHDLWRLGGLYRVGSFVGLAVSLAAVAIAMQRFVLPPQTSKGPT